MADKKQPLKSENICQHCNQHRIMRGSDVLVWVTGPDALPHDKDSEYVVDLHAQCVGPYLIKNAGSNHYIAPVMHDPNQIDLMEALKESLREKKVIPLVLAGQG